MNRPELAALLGPAVLKAADPAYLWRLGDDGRLRIVAANPVAEADPHSDLEAMRVSDSMLLETPQYAEIREDMLLCLKNQAPISREIDLETQGVRWRLLISYTPLTHDLVLNWVRDITPVWGALELHQDRARELEQLTEISHALLEAEEPQQVRDSFCRAALALAEADAVYLAEPRGDALVQTARAVAQGMPDHEPVRIPLESLEQSITREVFYRAQQVFLADFDSDPRADLGLAHLLEAASGFFAPLVVRGSAIGVLLVAWRFPLPAPPQRVTRLMPVLAVDAALAISRADLIAQLAEAAGSDVLTGLPNRRASDAELERHLAHAKRTGKPFSVAVLDINGLKKVNDEQGHDAGDELLRRAAEAWRHALRIEDQLARVGGDEFVLLMPDTDAAEAERAVARLQATAPQVSVAVGVAEWSGQHALELLSRADERMYADKQRHRASAATRR